LTVLLEVSSRLEVVEVFRSKVSLVQSACKVPVICQKMTSGPTAQYLPLLLVFAAIS